METRRGDEGDGGAERVQGLVLHRPRPVCFVVRSREGCTRRCTRRRRDVADDDHDDDDDDDDECLCACWLWIAARTLKGVRGAEGCASGQTTNRSRD